MVDDSSTPFPTPVLSPFATSQPSLPPTPHPSPHATPYTPFPTPLGTFVTPVPTLHPSPHVSPEPTVQPPEFGGGGNPLPLPPPGSQGGGGSPLPPPRPGAYGGAGSPVPLPPPGQYGGSGSPSPPFAASAPAMSHAYGSQDTKANNSLVRPGSEGTAGRAGAEQSHGGGEGTSGGRLADIIDGSESPSGSDINLPFGRTSTVGNIAGECLCGDGIIQWDIPCAENCDDGNTVAGDGCSASCLSESAYAFCGDGIVQLSERCDDGNTEDGDGCGSDCLYEIQNHFAEMAWILIVTGTALCCLSCCCCCIAILLCWRRQQQDDYEDEGKEIVPATHSMRKEIERLKDLNLSSEQSMSVLYWRHQQQDADESQAMVPATQSMEKDIDIIQKDLDIPHEQSMSVSDGSIPYTDSVRMPSAANWQDDPGHYPATSRHPSTHAASPMTGYSVTKTYSDLYL